MNKILLLLLLLVPLQVFAIAESQDYENPQVISTSNLQTVKKAVIGYVDTAEGAVASGTHTLGNSIIDEPMIPQGAIITDVYYRVKTSITAASTNTTISVGCATATDLVNTIDPGAFVAGELKAGTPVGAPGTNGVLLAASCTPTLTVAGESGGITTGKLEFVFEYIPLD